MTVFITGDATPEMKEYLGRFPQAVKSAARLSVNDASRFARKIAVAQMMKEINFPAGYLDDTRFQIVQFAQGDNLEAILRGRGRATSLRRFIVGNDQPVKQVGFSRTGGNQGGGLTVMVKPGQTRKMPGAFVVRLKSGAASISDDNFNLGLAVRLKPGQTIKSKYKYSSVELGHNVYLLYGPSVAQAFGLVRHDIASEVTSELTRQFARQFPLQLKTA